jgi:hypothetical protein
MRGRMASFSPRVLTWVAALPAWTDDLGLKLGLGVGEALLPDLLGRLESAGLIDTKEILGADGQLMQAFWLRPTARLELSGYLQASAPARLDQDLDDLATAVAAQGLGPTAPGSMSSGEWLRIVREYRPDSSGQKLMAEIDRLLKDHEIVKATGLAAAAQDLGALVSAPLAEAAHRAQRRIDHAIRSEQDLQRLRYYCQRPGIEQALEELMGDTGKRWALHLLGDGGMGKTTLIRYLASGRFAADRPGLRPFLVARVDFDDLDLRYPAERPAELLLALAAELAAFIGTRELDRRYREFRDAADELHERLAGRHYPGDDGATDPLEVAVAGKFAAFLNLLGAPVLLILDTCEELAKLYSPGARAPAIDQTFRLLELVRKDAEQMKVLFAGRRWLVPAGDDNRTAKGPLLQNRSYLRVFPVGGYSQAEADAYIDGRERARRDEQPDSAPLSPALRAVLLERSALRRPDPAEYSPFELTAYTEWAASDPSLDAEQLRSAPGDPYLEWRIIGRLGDARVSDALGIAAELGRFDRVLVASALAQAGIDAAAAFNGLAAQEWVNVLSLNEDGSPRVIEIDQHLLDRIRTLTAASPDRFPVDRLALGRDAAAIIDRTPLRELPVATVEAAIRLLPLAVAARLWQRIDDRIGDEQAWGWAAQVTLRVGAAEEARAEQAQAEPSGAGRPTILAAIIATQAVAYLHTRADPQLAQLWRDVERDALRHPDQETGAMLKLRAGLGRLAAGDLLDAGVLTEALLAEPPRLALLAGSIVAAAHGCVTRGDDLPDGAASLLADLAAAVGVSTAGAAAYLVAAVLRLWAGEGAAAAALADRAIAMADKAAALERGPHRADRSRPPRLTDQCRLARVLIAWRCGEAIDAIPWAHWRSAALVHLADIDAERLAAWTVRFELGHRVIKAEELARIEQFDRYQSGRRPSSWLHRQVGPLAGELAQAWSVRGDPDHGAERLRERREEAVAAGDDPDTIEACDLCLLQICRRQRTTAFSSRVGGLTRQGTAAARTEAWLVRTLVDGVLPKDPSEAGSWSSWWRCQDTESLALLADPPVPPPGTAPMDRAEFAQIFPQLARPEASDAGSPALRRDFDPETELRLGRRLTLPPGALGRAVMAVAELTALRFPERAVQPLNEAADQLRTAGDELGAAQALLLAGLAAARADDDEAAQAAWRTLADVIPAASPGLSAGWPLREAALGRYVNGQPPDHRSVSPEINLPASDHSPMARALSSLFSESSREVAVLGGGAVGVAAALVATGSADVTIGAVFAVVITLARVFAIVLPDRFIAARQIDVSQVPASSPGSGSDLRATAVASRGIRDLSGLRLPIIIGALAGRWPLWSMFAPRRRGWTTVGPADQPSSVSLDGLGLPRRGSARRQSLIAITMDDPDCRPLPWEQWLGRDVPSARQSSLLWYRRVSGPRPELRGERWRRAGALYRGPRDLAAGGQREAADPDEPGLRILHLIGVPVSTRAGWRLRVADARSVSSRATSRTGPGEELLSFDEFPLRRTALAVLQAEPVDGEPQSLGDLRPGFAGCAHDLLDGGVGAVLVIPPLPDEIARDVVATIWRATAARRRPPSPVAMLHILDRVRSMVATAAEQTPDSSSWDEARPDRPDRPALDVLLFLRTWTSRPLAPPGA